MDQYRNVKAEKTMQLVGSQSKVHVALVSILRLVPVDLQRGLTIGSEHKAIDTEAKESFRNQRVIATLSVATLKDFVGENHVHA